MKVTEKCKVPEIKKKAYRKVVKIGFEVKEE